MKRTLKLVSMLLAVVLAAAALIGCDSKPNAGDPSTEPVTTPQTTADVAPTPVPGNRVLGIRPANGSGADVEGELEKAYIDASNAFAAKLVNAMGENWTGVISPVSFGMLLEMLANGASDEESAAILKAMLNEMGIEETNENAARLIAALMKPSSAARSSRQSTAVSKFSMNSAILVNSADRFTESFETAIADHFKASVGNIDFSDTEKALETINGWVNENTNGLVPKLFEQIHPDTTMALINALYFNASWKTPFVAVKSGTFNGAAGEQVTSMLTATSTYAYGDFDGDRVVLVPYADGAYYMAVVLPKEGKAASAAFADTVSKYGECKDVSLSLTMPAIELETKLDAMPLLEKLELGSIARGDAQFPNIVENASIRLTQFVHAAVIKVSENGTEASAASGATGAKSAPAPDPEFSVICDRPYAMAIVHAETGAVLFASVVNELPSID